VEAYEIEKEYGPAERQLRQAARDYEHALGAVHPQSKGAD